MRVGRAVANASTSACASVSRIEIGDRKKKVQRGNPNGDNSLIFVREQRIRAPH